MGVIRGRAPSRLNELKKYRRDGNLSDRYFSGGNRNSDGVDITTSIDGQIIDYYIGGIRYNDLFDNQNNYFETTFDYEAQGTNTLDFVSLPLVKDFSMGNVVDQPEVESDVFIDRQAISIFENQYRLSTISNLSQLNFYAGGGYFNIVNNT